MSAPADPAARFVAAAADPHAVVRLLLEGLVTLELDAAAGEALLAQVVSKTSSAPTVACAIGRPCAG